MRTVTLTGKDQKALIGTVELASPSPGVPDILVWKGRVFKSGSNFGQGTEFYFEDSSLFLADDAVKTEE